MARAGNILLLLGFAAVVRSARDLGRDVQTGNPIRKVVTMLQDMEKNIRAEGKRDEELHKKYTCYCKTSGESVAASIATNTAEVPQLQADIEQAVSDKARFSDEVKTDQANRETAKQVMAEATAVREKEAAAFAEEKGQLDSNIATIDMAVAALKKGAYGTFVQTSTAATLRKLLSSKGRISHFDRSELLSFLSESHGSGYAPSSGEAIGILTELGEQFTADLAEATGTENQAVENHKLLMAAKTKEVEALTAAIERKMAHVAELGVQIVEMKNQLSYDEATLIEDKKFLADLETNCATQKEEFEKTVAIRTDELAAIADTIKLLSNDDSLDLFKKTLASASASASFVQVSGLDKARAQALEIIRMASNRSVSAIGKPAERRLDFLALALNGKNNRFDKVIKMIDEMVTNLQAEQTDDDDHVEFCRVQIDGTEDRHTAMEHTLAGAEEKITKASAALKKATEEMEVLVHDIEELDLAVETATEQRRAQHELYVEEAHANHQAKDLLNTAKQRLIKFYNPKLHKAIAVPKASDEERIANAFTFLQKASLATRDQKQAAGPADASSARPAAPEALGAYSKKTEENGGVLALLDMLVQDLVKELTEDEAAENNAQAAYLTLTADSAEKRATATWRLTELESIKSDLEGELVDAEDLKTNTDRDMMAVEKYLAQLHGECDWLVKYYSQRKEARASEIESLNEAKAVLSGADFALVQTEGKAPGRRNFLKREGGMASELGLLTAAKAVLDSGLV